MADLILPIFGDSAFSTEERGRIRRTADAILRQAQETTAGDARLLVFATMHALAYAIARSELKDDTEFQSRLQAAMPLYINAYRQDGGGPVFGRH